MARVLKPGVVDLPGRFDVGPLRWTEKVQSEFLEF
jgi:hypothetical protein